MNLDLSWMAWTWPTAAFFATVLLLLCGMAAWEYASPGGNPRVGKGGAILGTEPHVPHVLVKPRTMLRIDGGRTGDGKNRNGCDGELPHANLL